MNDNINNHSPPQDEPYDFLLDRLRENVQKTPNKIAVAYFSSSSSSYTSIDVERRVTYSELEDQTSRLAQHLIKNHGIKSGDR